MTRKPIALLLAVFMLIAACSPTASGGSATRTLSPTSEMESPTRPTVIAPNSGVNRTVKPTNVPAPTPNLVFPESAVELPVNYRETFAHFATVDRADGYTRDLYVNVEALDSYIITGALPDATTIVIEAYLAAVGEDGLYAVDEAGHYIKSEAQPMVHVMQKRPDWEPDDFVSEVRAGMWNFGSFDYETGERFQEETQRCFNCHNAMPSGRGEFIYTHIQLDRYVRTRLVQYLYCDLPDRIPCI